MTPRFKLVLILVFALTVLCGAGAALLSAMQSPSDLAADTAGKLLGLANLGMGALIGLLGGKAL